MAAVTAADVNRERRCFSAAFRPDLAELGGQTAQQAGRIAVVFDARSRSLRFRVAFPARRGRMRVSGPWVPLHGSAVQVRVFSQPLLAQPVPFGVGQIPQARRPSGRPAAVRFSCPVTNQVTTAPDTGRLSTTHSDNGVRLACGNPTWPDDIRRNRHAW